MSSESDLLDQLSRKSHKDEQWEWFAWSVLKADMSFYQQFLPCRKILNNFFSTLLENRDIDNADLISHLINLVFIAFTERDTIIGALMVIPKV